MKEERKIKILIKKDKILTRSELFERKEKFHKEQAKLPFEEKIKILIRLQEMASCIKGDDEKKMIWKICKRSAISSQFSAKTGKYKKQPTIPKTSAHK